LYSDFALKLKTGMSNLDFTPIMPAETAAVSAYIRISNPVAYIVQVFNCDVVSLDLINSNMSVLGKNIESQLNQMRCTNAVFVNLLYSDNANLDSLQSFCDLKEQDYSKLNYVWWYTDGKKLYFGKKQPTKFFLMSLSKINQKQKRSVNIKIQYLLLHIQLLR
jgi:hypothetical protein